MISVSNQPVYKTTDGQTFTVRCEAEKHELKLSLNNLIPEGPSKSEILCFILKNRLSLKDTLTEVCSEETTSETTGG